MRHSVIRLSRRHEWTVYLVVAAVFLTGAVWAWLHNFAHGTTELDDAPHPAEPWLMKLHGAAAMAVLIVVGTLLPYHAKFAWRAGRNRRTGSTLLAILAFLIATGYGLYYSGDERLRAWISDAHLYVGLAVPLLIALHVWRGKRTRPPRSRRF
jgi:cation transport ATPase